MARVSTYLNFSRSTEAAFVIYAYFGSLADRFGAQWMFDCASKD